MISVHRGHVQEKNSLAERIKDLKLDVNETSGVSPQLEKNYEFYQETKCYVSDLVECLQEKVYVNYIIDDKFYRFFYSNRISFLKLYISKKVSQNSMPRDLLN